MAVIQVAGFPSARKSSFIAQDYDSSEELPGV
jgi:hypothetical protein